MEFTITNRIEFLLEFWLVFRGSEPVDLPVDVPVDRYSHTCSRFKRCVSYHTAVVFLTFAVLFFGDLGVSKAAPGAR